MINLWELEAGQTLAQKLTPLLPFVPIMKGGQELSVLQEALTLLRADQSLSELELLLAFFARFVHGTTFIKELMRWDMTILKETDWYQEILKEGRREGVKEGRREGVKEGRREGVKEGLDVGRRAVEDSLLLMLTSRLGEVPADVKTALDRLNLAQLQTVFRAVLDVKTWDEVRAALPERS